MSSSTVTTSQVVRPQVAPGSHPIETAKYIIPTKAINLFHKTVLEWIENRAPGGVIYGTPRTGKTKAIRFLTGLLARKFGARVPIFSLLCREYRIPSEKMFFAEMLKAVGHALWNSGNSSEKLHRLIEYVVAQVEASGQNRLLWFLDEAQFLHEFEYNLLINVYNELDRRDVTPIFLLVGQPELLAQGNVFRQSNKTQILGRFMVRQFHFHGIKSRKDMAACLEAYDVATEFPDESKTSYTRYYFPEAFPTNFKLKACAEDLWQAFKHLREVYCLAGLQEIPMQYFCRTVEYVLKNYGTFDVAPTISARVWQEAIKASGYLDAEQCLVPPPKENNGK